MITLIQLGVVWGIVFGGVFSAAMLVIGRINPEMLLNSYPPDIRARYGPPSESSRSQAKRATVLLVLILGFVVFLGLRQLRIMNGEMKFTEVLLVNLVIFQIWNLLDLVLLDWFLLMTLKPKFMILPGTEGMPGYKDYKFHARKFLNGILATFILAVVVTCIALALEQLL